MSQQSMTRKEDGGPAFATPNGPDGWGGQAGMSLRDYFAAQALAGLVAGKSAAIDDLATTAYHIADQMIQQRSK